MVEAQDGAAPEKPVRTWRPMVLWSLAILGALALLWSVVTVVALHHTGMVTAECSSPWEISRNRQAVERLGGPELALCRIGLYLKLPPRLAPHNMSATVSLSGCGKIALPLLVKCLTSDPEFRVRQYAAVGLGLMGPEAQDAIPALIAALEDKGYFVPQSAALALGQIGSKDQTALPGLLKMLDNPNRYEAAIALGAMGPAAKEAIPALAKALKNGQVWLRKSAAEALGKIGPDAEVAIPDLIVSMADENFRVRSAAARTLSEFGAAAKDAIPALEKALQDANQAIRAADPEGRYTKPLDSMDQELRAAAAEALNKIRGEAPPK